MKVILTVERDLKLVSELGLKLIYVLDAHIHADHVTGAGKIRERVAGVKTAVPHNSNVPCAGILLKEGDKLKFGAFTIDALETPGHTDASLSFLCEDMVFTGDALLIRGTGRTDFQSGSAEILYDSVTGKLFKLPAETKVYPAHDYGELGHIPGAHQITLGEDLKRFLQGYEQSKEIIFVCNGLQESLEFKRWHGTLEHA